MHCTRPPVLPSVLAQLITQLRKVAIANALQLEGRPTSRASRSGLFLAYFVLRMQDAYKVLFPGFR